MTDLGLLALRFHEMVVRHTLMDFASCHYDMAVCHARNHAHFVAHQYDGGGGCERFHYLIEVRLKLLVDVAQWLIEHQHRGFGDNGSPKQCALELSARKFADGVAAHIVEPHQFDGVVHQLPILCRGAAKWAGHQPRRYHFFHGDGKLAVDGVFLGQIAEFQPFHLFAALKVEHAAFGGLEQMQYQAENGGFSAAVRPSDCHEIAFVHGEIHILQHHFLTKCVPHVVYRYDTGFFHRECMPYFCFTGGANASTIFVNSSSRCLLMGLMVTFFTSSPLSSSLA